MAAEHPISHVEWVHPDTLTANDYNPNVQPPPEYRLLKISLLEDGWTQPIVVFDDGSGAQPIIVDGEHRWRLARDPEVAKLTGGLVPIVRIVKDRGHRLMSTIRHNRARGEHTVARMAEIVRELLESGYDPADVGFLMQMELEEVDRLADRAGMPTRGSSQKPEFSKGWVPG